MSFISLCSKPKNQKARRALEYKAPKLIENCKTAMFIRGSRSSQLVTQTLVDLVSRYMWSILLYKFT